MNARTLGLALVLVPAVCSADVTIRQLTRYPVAVNGDGTVCVYQLPFFAIRQAGTGPETWLPNLSGSPNAASLICNDGSTIIGRYGHHSFRWRADTGTVDLGELDSGGDTIAYGASADGGVVVGFSYSYAFRWTAATGMQQIPVPAGVTNSRAQCVSANGQIAAGCANGLVSPYVVACRWSSGDCTPLGTVGSDLSSNAIAMSGDGSVIAGWSNPNPSVTHLTPFVWTAEHGLEPLALPAGMLQAQPTYVSTDGKLVYGLAAAWSGYFGLPWLWSRTLGTVEFNEQLSRMGVDLHGEPVAYAYLSADKRSMIYSTAFASEAAHYYLVNNLPPFDCGPADLGRSGGLLGGDGKLDNNDFIQFIDLFFAADARADLGEAGGLPGSDGVLDNNDFVAFIGRFFDGCQG